MKKDMKHKDKSEMVMDMNIEKDLYEWVQMDRPFKKRDREFWLTAIAILVLISIIFIYLKEFLLVVALFSALFLYYTLSTIEPNKIKYRITNRGIYWGDSRMEWGMLRRFWIKPSLDSEVINFETNLRFPRQVAVIINPEDREKIKNIIARRIPCLEESPQLTDKVTNWFGKKFPLESKKAS